MCSRVQYNNYKPSKGTRRGVAGRLNGTIELSTIKQISFSNVVNSCSLILKPCDSASMIEGFESYYPIFN
jgi:hypothetical protein